jgi:hypothetical protein
LSRFFLDKISEQTSASFSVIDQFSFQVMPGWLTVLNWEVQLAPLFKGFRALQLGIRQLGFHNSDLNLLRGLVFESFAQ